MYKFQNLSSNLFYEKVGVYQNIKIFQNFLKSSSNPIYSKFNSNPLFLQLVKIEKLKLELLLFYLKYNTGL